MDKITFLGAGSTVFAKNVLGDCITTDAMREFEYALYDIDHQRLEESYMMLSNINRNSNDGKANAIVLFATSSVSTVCVGAVMVCVNAMMMDTIEYGEWKTGQRNEAMITSTRCFVTKCVMAVAGIAVAAVIGLTGYIPQETVQPVNVLNSFHFVYTLVSAGIIILAVVPMLFYKLTEKRHAEIMEELAARKASKTQ